MRPRRLVLVTGTGTEVGKTWVAAALLAACRGAGWTVAARKPAQSFDPPAPGEGTDADRLARSTGEPVQVVCPPERTYPVAMAPPMAADRLGLPFPAMAALAAEVTASWPSVAVDLGLVEGAGGVAAPQAPDGDTVALIAAIRPQLVVLVADAGLGTINHVRLSVAALGPWPTVVHLNRYRAGDDLHRRNRSWLAERDGLAVTTGIPGLEAAVRGIPVG